MKHILKITDEIVSDALAKGVSVSDMLAVKYQGEIADLRDENPAIAQLNPLQVVMYSNNVTKNTRVQELYGSAGYQTSGNEWLFPVYIEQTLREEAQAMDIMPYICPNSTVDPGMAVTMCKLVMDDDNKDAVQLKDVVEGTDLPLAVLKLSEASLRLKKRGRAVQSTYEAIMYSTLDMMRKHISLIANNVSHQQVGDALDTLINGDGNNNAAPQMTLTGSSLTQDEMISFLLNFHKKSNMPMDTIICGDGKFYDALLKMTFSDSDVRGILPGTTVEFPQLLTSRLSVVYDPRIPQIGSKEILIGLNRDKALLKHISQGSQIREFDKNIRNQTNLGTVSEIAGFEKFSNNASMILKAQ